MSIRNTTHAYGWVSIVLHWGMAVGLIGMYFLGDYMVTLDYYDANYHVLPTWHKTIGLCLLGVWMLRLAWILSHPRPLPVPSQAPVVTHTLAKLGHFALYGLMLVLFVSGYLISTAKGHGIDFLGGMKIPALLPVSQTRGDTAGLVHEVAATLFIVTVGVHALAALIHHFYWKDHTLTRMLGKS